MTRHNLIDNRQLLFATKSNITEVAAVSVLEKSLDVQYKTNWVIIMALNDGYLDFFLNWFASYKKSNVLVPIVLVAEDKAVYDKIKSFKFSMITVKESNNSEINSTVVFQSRAFMDLTLRRHTYVLNYLLTGRDVIFSDTDTVWLKNPVPYFTGDYDIWMQYDTPEILCPGTMAVKSNNETIDFFRKLTRGLETYAYSDQPFLNDRLKKSKLRIKGLDKNLFPSGKLYFQFLTKKQKAEVVVVHNNWIKGHDRKVDRFKKFNLWFNDRTIKNIRKT
ncbi:uncharacterized protein LOC132747701 [Ruditapes philippinarum]|uniref:uncharacterized protein LOC132747701 n=1 Tax=Ruditapes philippinarum TaxID=129788 RepID=UPI00295B2A60|nr:uncharacterized protein LOC132747701 [Ruditapes philippinarum]